MSDAERRDDSFHRSALPSRSGGGGGRRRGITEGNWSKVLSQLDGFGIVVPPYDPSVDATFTAKSSPEPTFRRPYPGRGQEPGYRASIHHDVEKFD